MKQPLFFAFLTFIKLALPASATHYQVYLLGGQSNGNGRADAAQLTAPLDAAQTDVRFYWHRTQAVDNVGHLPEDTWTDLAPGSGHGSGAPVYDKEFGPEVSFGRAMADAKPLHNIAIIKYTHGGSNLSSNWAAGGPRYTSFVSTVQAGLTALTNDGHTYELRGMLWQQGESDTGGASADNYETNLTNLIARVRADVFAGGALPFLIGTISDSQYPNITTPGSGPYKVRQAQETVAAADSAAGVVITDGYDTRINDSIHFNHDGQIALGQNFATLMLSLEGPDDNPPDLVTNLLPADNSSGAAVDDNLVITFDEPVQKGSSGNIVIKENGGSTFEAIPVGDARVTVAGNMVTINPAGTLSLGTGYHVQISDGAFEDLGGNPWSGIPGDDTSTWNFNTFSPANSLGTTGFFDENLDATNQLDLELSPGTLAPFQAAVLEAYNNNLGGVIDWETGVTATPSSGPSPQNTLSGSYGAIYGSAASQILTVTFDRSMDLYTNDINNQVSVLSQQGAFHNALIPSGGNDAVGLEYTLTFTGGEVIEFGAALPSRSTYSTGGVDFRATTRFSGGGTEIVDFTISGTVGTGDTFLHFSAPAGEAINSLTVAFLDDNGQGLSNGQRRPILDDLGFVIAPPANTFANWAGDPAFGLEPSEQGFADDPDGDSLANGLEAWLGTHPGESSTGITNLTTNGTTTSFIHPQNETPLTNLIGSYQWSQTLDTWYAGDGVDGPPDGPTVTITSESVEGSTTVTATASEPLGKFFLRIAVQN